jgi:hypothetical protein
MPTSKIYLAKASFTQLGLVDKDIGLVDLHLSLKHLK